MPNNRDGIPVDAPVEGARRAFLISIPPTGSGWLLVGHADVPTLGFTYETALNASRSFSQELYDLSRFLDERRPPNSKLPDYQERLQRSLDLSEGTGRTASQQILRNLTSIGAPLWSELSEEMKDALEGLGFPGDEAAGKEEPAFTFQMRAKAPILWEIMYDLPQSTPVDWRRFWGFRVPISHWIGQNRTRDIYVRRRNGVFCAINESLEFADQEVRLLRQHLAHTSLASEFRERIERAVAERMTGAEQARLFWEEGEAKNTWLRHFFELMNPDSASRQLEADEWKLTALKEIFTSPEFRYDLLHFACHCEPSTQTPFLSRLDLRVAGEPVHLDVGFLASDLKRNKQWRYDDPGPLVFLNACGTSESRSPGYEPPGFPNKWIESQGALAVIATLCPVPDFFAHAFAQKFYEILFDRSSPRNSYPAETLLKTRRFFMETYHNPLGLAYALYSVEGARVWLDSEEDSHER